MSRKTVVEFTDDLDGSHAHATVRFSIDDTSYEIDLSEKNIHALHDSLAPYIEAARKIRNGVVEPERFHAETDVDPRAVRQWARARGIELPARARVPKDIVELFRAAGN